MSKESYMRGFCKVAEANGVDPQALAKYAQDTAAGIGSYIANEGRGTPSSYVGKLSARARRKNVEPPAVGRIFGPYKPRDLVTQPDLLMSRNIQASGNASRLAEEMSDPWLKIWRNLMNAGKENQSTYKQTGVPRLRNEPDMTGIEDMKFTEEQLKQLKDMQNTMARKGVPRTGSIA